MAKLDVEYIRDRPGFKYRTVKREGVTHIELSRQFGILSGTTMLVIVSVDGYNKGSFEALDAPAGTNARYWSPYMSTKGIQVRMSMNGPSRMTMDEFYELHDEISLALKWLTDQQEQGLINQ